MVDRVLKAILFFTPIAYYPGVFYYKFELIFFQTASILLFIACLIDIPKRRFKLGKPLALYLGICLFSVMINNYNIRSMSALINILIGCADILIISIYAQDLKKCTKWLALGIGINTVIFIGQQFGYNPIIKYQLGGIEHGGVVGNAPRFASLVALSIPFISVWCLIPLFILGFFLKEVSVFVAILAIIAYKVWTGRYLTKCLFWTCLFCVVGIGVFFWRTSILTSINVRLMIWKEVVREIVLNPFKGHGLAGFKYCDYAQSSFLQWIHGVGILGIGFIALCLRKIKWYLVPLLFLCVVEYPFQIPRLWFLIIFTIAYYAVDNKEEVELC